MADDAQDEAFSETIDLPQTDEDLIRIYAEIGRSVDELAYTPEFKQLFRLYKQQGHHATMHEVFRRLLILRKSGLLPRLFSPSAAPVVKRAPRGVKG